jgi:hypothetical protein
MESLPFFGDILKPAGSHKLQAARCGSVPEAWSLKLIQLCYAGRARSNIPLKEAPMPEKRGITIHFNDGSKLSMDFPAQTPNEAARLLKLDDVLKKRYMLFEADGTLLMIPFENVRYVQMYPAPADIPGHTYVKGASARE